MPCNRSLPSIAAALGVLAALAPAPLHAAGFTALGPDGGSLAGFAQSPEDPDRLYCLPSGLGVFRSDDRGVSWQRVDTGIDLDCLLLRIAVAPTDADLLLVGDPGSDRLLRSIDGGATYVPVPVASNWNEVAAIAFDPHDPDIVLVAIADGPDRGFYRSTDAGVTFTSVNTGITPGDPAAIAYHPLAPGTVLAGNGAGIHRSTDSGATWSLVHDGWVTDLACCAASPSRAWGIVSGLVVRSADGGETFAATAQQPPRLEQESYSAIAAHPTDADAALVGQVYWECGGECFPRIVGVSRTTNGGAEWSYASYDPQSDFWGDRFLAFAFDAEQPSRVYAAIAGAYAPQGGLVRSVDAGVSFLPFMNGIHGVRILSLGRDDTGAVYARRAGTRGLWRAASAGGPWDERPTAGIQHPTCFESHRAVSGFLHEAGVVTSWDTATPVWARSANGGQTWSFGDSPPGDLFSFPQHIRFSADGATTYLWTDDWGKGWLLHRSDDGTSFTTTVRVFPTAVAVVDRGDALRLFAADQSTGAVKLSTDGGATWTPRVAGLPAATPVDLFQDPASPDRLAVVYRTGGAFRSDDAGLTWSKAPLPLGPGSSHMPHSLVASLVVAADWDPDLDRFALATLADGALVTGLGFVTEGLPTRDLTDILFEPVSGKVLVSTKHAGVFAIDAPDPTAAPLVAATAAIDLCVAPNPFRGAAVIRLALPEPRSVSIAIFAVDGRRVATLRSGSAEAGEIRVAWDGRDAAGRAVAPGVYFVRAKAGGEAAARRVVRTR